MKKVSLEGEGGGGNWAEITLVKTSEAVTKNREKFDPKLTGAARVQETTAGAFLRLSPPLF